MNEEDLQLSRVQPNRQKATTKKKEQIEELLIWNKTNRSWMNCSERIAINDYAAASIECHDMV